MTVTEVRLPKEDPRLGRHVYHDEQSRNFPAPRQATPTSDIRHRNFSRYKLYQADIGACVAFTGAQAMNTSPYRAQRVLREVNKGVLSRQVKLYREATAFEWYSAITKIDPFPGSWPPDDTGSNGLAMAKHLLAIGEISRYEWAFGYDHGVQSLPLGPLMQGTWWTWDMFRPAPDGRVRPMGGDAGGHEYLWVGLEVRSKLNPSQNRSWFLNSWEDERNARLWGVEPDGSGPGGGYFYMTQDDHRHLLSRQGDLIRLVV